MIPTVADDGVSENPLERLVSKKRYVAYHGTSSAYSASIEARGLDPELAPWTAEECRAVCAVFDALEWPGSFGLEEISYPTLAAWGPSRDIPLSGRRHLYLAHAFRGATIYANVPGGETFRALRNSLEDLVRFEQDATVRVEHLERLTARLRRRGYRVDSSGRLLSRGQHTSDVDKLLTAMALARDGKWLKARNSAFRPLLARLREIEQLHEPVVYAVLLSEDPYHDTDALLRPGTIYKGDGISLEVTEGMGIEVADTIPVERILAKATSVISRARG